MKLLIFGNIGCGKSTLVEEILKTHKEFNLLNIDNFRRKYGDGTIEKEKLAKSKFIEAVSVRLENQIIECSGLGETGEMLFERLSQCEDVKIVCVLLAESSLCIHRIANRIWDIPYPDKFSNASKLINAQAEVYKSDELKNKWDGRNNLVFVSLINNTINDFRSNSKTIISLINETEGNNK